MLCGAETWLQMKTFARSKEDFFRKFLSLENGIPSEDTINRVFSAIYSDEFESCFIEWVNSISVMKQGQVIAIDGKNLRGAKSHGKISPINMVSAWANDNNLVLGQVRVNEKSNEITVIPRLLETLNVEVCIITIDAMGTQTEIANTIVENGADYILAVKGNQKQLLEEIKDEVHFSKNTIIDETIEIGHGRLETRKCSVVSRFQFINVTNSWRDLKSVIKIESIREFKNSDKPTEKAVRYYISNRIDTTENFQKNICSHWGVRINYIGHWMKLFQKMRQEKEIIMQLRIILSF